MSKIRVLHCLQTIGSGGVEQRRLLLAKNLDKNKYEQAVVCTETFGIIPNQLVEADCHVFPVGTPKHPFDPKIHRNVMQVIKDFKPHIIHGAVFEGVTMAAICGTLSRVPIIIGEETSDPINRKLRANLLLKTLSLLTNKMVGVSPASCDYLVNKAFVNKSKVILINNGIEPTLNLSESQKNTFRQTLNIHNDSFVIGFVGRLLDNHKRISDLIIAFSRISNKNPQAQLLIVGDGPDKVLLMQLADNLNISEKVIFSGYQSDTTPFFNIMDVFVLPSAREAFGLVLVEAMFTKIPIIASRVGGIPYIVKDGLSGFLFEPTDIESLATLLQYMINNPLEAAGMGSYGYEIATKEFSSQRYIKDVDNLYQKLIKNNPITSHLIH